MYKIDQKYLPSKNFITALSVATIIILITIGINYWKTNTTKYTNNKLLTNENINKLLLELDSDEDKLPDWKENLYGTDPKNTDTDSDGTSDFDETEQNRDPIKANLGQLGQEPTDKIDLAILEETKKEFEEYENLNATDKLARNLFSNIIAAQPTTGKISEEDMNSILSKATLEIPQKTYSGITTIDKLNLVKTGSTDTTTKLSEYGKIFATETIKLQSPLIKNIDLLNVYISNDDVNTATEILKLNKVYENVLNSLIKMPIPVAIGYYDINYHLMVINDLEKIIAINKDIVSVDKNQLEMISMLSNFEKTFDHIVSTIITIAGVLNL